MTYIPNQQTVRAFRLRDTTTPGTAWLSALALTALLLVFSSRAHALMIAPNPIEGSEGTVAQVTVVISVEDWVRPNDDFSKQCAQIGVNAKFVTRYFLKRVNGSATYGSSASFGDLHMVSSGKPKSDIYLLWCYPGTLPSEQMDNSVTLDLHADELDETLESAALELYKVDLEDKKTFVSSTPILITNVNGTPVDNACSSTSLDGDSPLASGSIAESDCDDSPRGSGYLADKATFRGQQGESITLDVAWRNMDGYLYLQGPDGAVEAENDDYLSTADSRIRRTLGKTGTYTVWVTTRNKSSTGTYQLTLSREEATSTCNRRTLDCGSAVTGSLVEDSCTAGPQGPGFRAEEFRFTGEAGSTLWLDARWDFDGYLVLENPLGQVVAENDNGSEVPNSHIEHRLEMSGAYTLWATSYQPGASGSYELELGCDPPDGPDLTLDMPPLPAELLAPGQRLELTADLTNSGDGPADSTTLRYVLSSDSRIDASDPEWGSDGAPGLLPGEWSAHGVTLAAPASAGVFWMGVCADAVPGEASLTNNCSAGARLEVSAQPECARRTASCGDLVSGELTGGDCSAGPRGTGFLAEVLEMNLEAGKPLVVDATWYGIDGYLVLEDPSGSVVAFNDDAADQQHSTIEFAPRSSGVHRLWTTSAGRGATGSFGVELTCGLVSAPDLVAAAVSVSANEAATGATLELEATLANEGNSTAGATNVHFVLSSDEVISADDTVLASQGLQPIPAHGSAVSSTTVTLPREAGNYWLGVCVESVIDELLNANNCSQPDAVDSDAPPQDDSGLATDPLQRRQYHGTLVTVSAGPACSGSALSCGQTGSGALGGNACDQGPRGAGYASGVHAFSGNAGDVVSLNAQWTGLDGYLYLEDPAGAVVAENDDFENPGRSRIETRLEHSGTYRIWSSAQSQGQGGSYELQLTCNAPAGPDLLAQVPQLSAATVRVGQELSISTEVLNQGMEPAADTSVRFILLRGAEAEVNGRVDGRVLGRSDVAPLSPGGSGPESASATLDVAPGTYRIAACVDAEALESDTANNCAVSGALTVEPGNRPIDFNPGLNDAWYDPDSPGQGFFINVLPDGNQVFLSWFTYDLERPDAKVSYVLGDPGHRWLIALGPYERGVATMDVFLNKGGVFGQAVPAPTESPYGSVTLSFSDCNHGMVEFDIPAAGQQGAIAITRVTSDNIGACEDQLGARGLRRHETAEGTNGDGGIAASSFRFTPGLNDAWYDPAIPGQGFFFNVFPQREAAFVAWFTYDTERPAGDVPSQLGEPGLRWLTALGRFDGHESDLTLYRVAGGVFNSGSPVPTETEYGTLALDFADCNAGALQYDIPSLSLQGVVPVRRVAADSIPVCEQAQIRRDEAALRVSPHNKAVLDNFCGGATGWHFDWPDVPHASGYLVELWRDDALRPMTFKVAASEFRYAKPLAIPPAHLAGWKWRYQPQFPAMIPAPGTAPGTAAGQASDQAADFSPAFGFDVGTCEP